MAARLAARFRFVAARSILGKKLGAARFLDSCNDLDQRAPLAPRLLLDVRCAWRRRAGRCLHHRSLRDNGDTPHHRWHLSRGCRQYSQLLPFVIIRLGNASRVLFLIRLGGYPWQLDRGNRHYQ